MLIQFRFKNFSCFYDESVLDLSATSEKRHSDYLVDKNGINLLPVVSIHGANASGKSSVIEAFFTMANLVVNSFKIDSNEPLPIPSFMFNKNYAKQDTEFEIFISIDDFEYQYGFCASQNGITKEWLYEKPFKKNTTAKRKCLFKRQHNKIETNNNFTVAKQYGQFLNDKKTLLLSLLGRKQVKKAKDIYNWFINTLCIDEDYNISYALLDLLYSNKELKKDVDDFMKEIDPCIQNINIEKKENIDKTTKFEVYFEHSDTENKDIKYGMPLNLESFGTKKAMRIIPAILIVLTNGGTIFIDELDIQFHPLLYRKIVSMFLNPKINSKHAQLIYTAHSTFLLSSREIRRDQAYFVSKNNNGMSKIYSLSDFQNLRGDNDYEKKYLLGDFGAIPFQGDTD